MTSITIIHVARRAGVSAKTVSRVFNEERYVRAELRDRVLQAARELNYRPHITARSLRGRRAYVVCLLLTVVSPYAVQAQRGALKACQDAGYHLMVEPMDPGAADALEALVRALSADGMLLIPPLCDDLALLDVLEAHNVPYVRISPARSPRRGLTVAVDDEGAARTITDHLLDLGHRRIGFIGGLPDHSAARQRLKGFRKAFAARALEIPDNLVVPGRFDFLSGREGAARLLASDPTPTAIVASNDLDAAGVMAHAHERGLRLPRDLSVTGFDDDLFAPMLWPPLTTMHQPIARMAGAATDLLIRTAADGAPPTRPPPFHCSLVVRGSTAPPRARLVKR